MCSKIFVITFLLVISTRVFSQVNMVYHIGIIGNVGTVQKIYSGPVVIDADQCFEISNGLKTFARLNTGLFSNNCIQLLDKADIRYIGYPNPSTSYIILKTTIYAHFNDGEMFLVQVSDMLGRVMVSYKTDLNSLNAGFRISTAKFSSGVYNIKVVSASTKMQSVKIIKTIN